MKFFLLIGLALGNITYAEIVKDLQKLVDNTPKHGVLTPSPGIYQGPITIEKPITLDGKGQVTINGGGKGSVIYLDSDGVTLRNLKITNSGDSHNNLDSGIMVRGSYNVIKDNIIDECLFGIDLGQAEHNIIRRNHISSKKANPLGLKGDAVRLWYSFNNKIEDNTIGHARDVVVWYSKDNIISGNKITDGRYSLHFMYSQGNQVENNHLVGGSIGIFLMYSDGIKLKNNFIVNSQGDTGMGIGLKETSAVEISGNKVLYCATGIYNDLSPYQPDTVNIIKNNIMAFNGVGMLFHNGWHGNKITRNVFKSNLSQVVVEGGNGANNNLWRANVWDDYEGFDLDENGIGDTPYKQFAYADRIWMDVPKARFFRVTPLLSSLDFLERLLPFSDPLLILEDKQPIIDEKATTAPD